jgi:anti-anti-sigma factor
VTTLDHDFASPLAVAIASGRATVRVAGDLDLLATEDLAGALDVLLAQRVERIDVDLRDVDRIDSASIELLATAHQRLACRGGRLAVVGAGDAIVDLLHRRGLSGLLRAG